MVLVPSRPKDARAANLNGIFTRVLSGKQSINRQHGKHFLEAICLQLDPVATLQKLMNSTNGQNALRTSLFSDDSAEFLSGYCAKFLTYLQNPDLKTVYVGSFLQGIVNYIVEPPIFWDALVRNVKAKQLSDEALQCFGWLLQELLVLPSDKSWTFYAVARDDAVRDRLDEASRRGVQINLYKIKSIADAGSMPNVSASDEGPGGRHDNDSADISEISILPTINELECPNEPYLRRATEIEIIKHPSRLQAHIDNQFRLLREDMLRELKEELQSLKEPSKRKRKSLVISNLTMVGVKNNDKDCWSLKLQSALDILPPGPGKDRLERVKKLSRNFLRHEAVCCIVTDGRPLILVSLDRDEVNLAEEPPILCVRFPVTKFLHEALVRLKKAETIQLLQLNAPIFAYEPVLKQLQNICWLGLGDEIMYSTEATPVSSLNPSLEGVLQGLETDPSCDLQGILQASAPTTLDTSQLACFKAGLTQQVSLIQGPPGTGKSYIGALIAKALYLFTSKRVLVLSYTNHALVQFLEDLLDVNIPASDIVRLGSRAKASGRTEPLGLYNQSATKNPHKLDWSVISRKRDEVQMKGQRLANQFAEYHATKVTPGDLMEHSEFDLENPHFLNAFDVPTEDDGMKRVGKGGKTVDKFYLFNRWCRGHDAGVYPEVAEEYPDVWSMSIDDRKATYSRWKDEVLNERVETFSSLGTSFNKEVREITMLFGEKNRAIIRSKRIIGCTTTAAAKYVQDIQAAAPEIVLVEEAGEIHESHVLTALGPDTEQLILIGDHKQLRPKVHYDLSVAKGLGYDADVSMFERLIRKGYPHQTLSEQHRMRPEISALVRELTYPTLTDATETLNRPGLRGFQSNLVFVNHDQPEDSLGDIPDPRDGQTGLSKRNDFEARMTLACVRYLAQQGYNSENIVVLTPYVAQLRHLFDVLSQENDPILNDMDSHDLVKAGLMPSASARLLKRQLRISSIDNYQGEQSDIVIITLTRSNKVGDIGFLSSPERLNVLLSRARNAMILIGNANTFLNARKGKKLWLKFFNLLKDGLYIHEGFPVVCDRHPVRKSILASPDDFTKHCPDGGCDQPCGAMLQCGKHKCPSKCHQLVDHSKMKCLQVIVDQCAKGHKMKWRCFEAKPSTCKECDNEERLKRQKVEREFAHQLKLEKENELHEARLQALNDEIRKIVEMELDRQLSEERHNALVQRQHDLDQARGRAAKSQSGKPSSAANADAKQQSQQSTSPQTTMKQPAVPHPTSNSTGHLSPSEQDWARQKRAENASNSALDELMAMTGLEEVKAQFLKIKAKLETAQRQGTNLRQERFGTTLLGNPGTGKTTVARLYAKFLNSVDVLPGSTFVETTGSRLANEGVNAAKAHIESLLKNGGGTIFIDEAYQLASGNSLGGSAVLDFILAEIENLTGKVVFLLAGYNKQMEKFFQHNQGFSSRMPYSLQFNDYTDGELLSMFEHKIKKRYQNQMQLQDGISGLYARILVKRLGRGRGQEGFGNARALENVIAQVAGRQADRIQKERAAGMKPDDFLLSKEDLIGPEPVNALAGSNAWKELQGLIGLQMVKESVQNMITRIQLNYRRELQQKEVLNVSLNRVFLGSPGTGKTSVGKLYGQVLKDIGVLSNGEVIIKNPSDFVDSVIGGSEKNTRAILESTKGKVLIIDEAYMLYTSDAAGKSSTDPYKTAVVDTIVAEVQSTPGEDRCVLLLGYRDKLEEMFKNTNPGLARRFPLSDAFQFQDFTDDELRQILELKLKKQDLDATDEAKKVALEVLSKARRRMNFGNGGEVENLLTRAKDNYETRYKRVSLAERPMDMVFEPGDFDKEYKRSETAGVSCRKLFEDVVGCEDIVQKLEGYTKTVSNMRARGMDPSTVIPLNFVFKGPPGTGKTTTARKMGQIYFDMGFLASSEVCECSATDLIGQYVGQTGPKTTGQLEKALGKVLFIDEAYRLGEGNFATEAVNELVDNLTKPKFSGKILVILAGYTDAMNDLLQVNQGLASRFPEEVVFQNMRPEHALNLLRKTLEKSGVEVLTTGDSDVHSEIIDVFQDLAQLRSWGNGRDINTISNDIISKAFRDASPSDEKFSITDREVAEFLQNVLKQKAAREGGVALQQMPVRSKLPAATDLQTCPQRQQRMSTSTKAANTVGNQTSKDSPSMNPAPEQEDSTATTMNLQEDERDHGVSNEIWCQLQKDKEAERREDERRAQRIANADQAYKEAEQKESHLRQLKEDAILKEKLAAQKKDEEKENEARRAREQARLAYLNALAARQEAEERRKRAQKELDRKRKEEAQVQRKLQDLGVCPVGFRWIKQAGGYRCAGGSHFVTDTQLGI